MLLSPTFRDQLGYKVGGKFIFWPRGDEDRKIETTIVGFIDYFPGFQPGKMGLNPDGTAYQEAVFLIVANLADLQDYWGVKPYEVWFDMDDTSAFYKFAAGSWYTILSAIPARTAAELSFHTSLITRSAPV